MTRLKWLWFLAAAMVLGMVYLPTLQTIPNGSSHYYMIDVGETQIVLNNWGTLHPTGYPLFVMTGNVITEGLTAIGIDPVVVPALVAMFWGVVALALLFALVEHLTQRAWLAGLAVVAFGLTRTVWIHLVIAEIYTFGLVIVMGLLCLGLWRAEIKGRIYWMALLGGIGVAHHRAIALMIPALLVAAWPHFMAQRRHLPRLIVTSLVLGLLGFSQYAYLYFRGRSGAAWVYGEPGTLRGLWDQFIGTEASRFIGPADSLDALGRNLRVINDVLLIDLTLPGIVLGMGGLILATRVNGLRRPAWTLVVLGLASYVFHVTLYSDVLSALILQVTVSVALGWAFLAEFVLKWADERDLSLALHIMPAASILALCLFLFSQNRPFITDLTEDPSGLQTIEQVRAAPAGSTVMLAWGPRYFAASFAHDITGDLQHIQLVDHKADFRQIVSDGPLLTPEYTRFNQPREWWEARLGGTIYPQAAAPGLVEIQTAPQTIPNPPEGVTIGAETVTCNPGEIILEVIWQTGDKPDEDLSVFVHALRGDDPAPVAQADVFAPVYGWRPLITWLPGEQVRDIYRLALDDPARIDRVRYGLYRVVDGGFENMLEQETMVDCDA